jgi:hypothetical protein
MRRIILALILAFLPAVAEAGCITDQYGGLVCGEGKDAVRVFDDTTSPSKKFALGWRDVDGIPTGDKMPAGEVEHVLIRLDDGAVLGTLPGDYWDTGAMHANRYEVFAAWSPDSRAVVEVGNGRWDTTSFACFVIDGGNATKLDLLALVAPALRAKLPASQREGRAFRVLQEEGVKLDAHGHLRFKASLFIPKSESSLDYAVAVDIASSGAEPKARIVSVQKIKIDPRP